MSQIISAAQYEELVIAGLRRVGLSADQAVEVASNRWPMGACDAISECAGRGLAVELGDMTAYLQHRFQRTTFDDGAELTAESLHWTPPLVQGLLDWCQATGRGESAPEIPAPEIVFISVADMLEALRSESIVDRLKGGFALAQSLGTGLALQGEHREDVEFIQAPHISKLIGWSIATGDPETITELEQHVTAEYPARRRALGAN